MTKAILPPATIGVIGGGQLGMMVIREAQRMGYRSVVWDPDPECPAARLADMTIVAPFTDTNAASRLGESADVVTYEFENVDPSCVDLIAGIKPMAPASDILRISRHRKVEKEALKSAGFPVVEFRIARDEAGLKSAVDALGFPVVVKTVTAGYDGKGQVVLHNDAELNTFCRELHNQTEYVVEQFLSLQREISVIAVRGYDDQVTTFPVVDNEHRENILHVSRVPAQISPETRERALALARGVIARFHMTGVLCIEMFVTHDDTVLVNELAPRPHNSGHFSLDACSISQFEALVRSMCRLPIPEPRLLTPCAMVNLLGKHLNRIDLQSAQRIPGVKIHLYGKKRNEPKRKMGHATILGVSQDEVEERVAVIEEMIGEGPGMIGKGHTAMNQKRSVQEEM